MTYVWFAVQAFDFDRVFGPEVGQAGIFEDVSQLVTSALDGYNVCSFAYGQTGQYFFPPSLKRQCALLDMLLSVASVTLLLLHIALLQILSCYSAAVCCS